MRELSLAQVEEVSGGILTAAQGAALVLTLSLAGPVGFAMGFGFAVAAGLVYAAAFLER